MAKPTILANSTVEIRTDVASKQLRLVIVMNGQDIHTVTFNAEQMDHHTSAMIRCCRRMGIEPSELAKPGIIKVTNVGPGMN